MAIPILRTGIPLLKELQIFLPSFVLQLKHADIEEYIVDGFVSRQLILQGRFSRIGYIKAMYSAEDTTPDALLDSKIPEKDADPVYKGEATGCTFSIGSHEIMLIVGL